MDRAKTNAVKGQCFRLRGRLRRRGGGHAVDQLVAERPEIGAAGAGRIIAGRPRCSDADGNIRGAENFWPINAEPTACVSSVVKEPSFFSSDPLAWTGKIAWPMPQITSG